MQSRRARSPKPAAGARRAPSASAQLTVRNVPVSVDRALRRKAATEHRSLNEVLVEALGRGGGGIEAPVYDDLDHLAGTWKEDPGFDKALAEQDRVDEGLWR